MLMMFEKGIRGGMCQAVHRYYKASNKYMKNYYKNKGPLFLLYLDANIYLDGQCHKNYL